MRAIHFFTLFVLLLTGCGQQELLDKLVPQEESAFAKQFISHLSSGNLNAVEPQLAPSLKGPETTTKLAQVATLFPPGEPTEVQVVGARVLTSSKGSQYDLSFQYVYAKAWVLVNVVLEKDSEKLAVAGVHVTPLRDSLQSINSFSFAGKSTLHFAFFALAIAIPIFILVTLFLCIRTPVPKRKWLWLLFIAVGLVQFSLNWSSGEVNMQPISFLLFGAGYAQAGLASPYIFTIAIPIGAILFYVQRRKWHAQSAV